MSATIYKCQDCGADVDHLEVFPGPRCLACWTPIGEREAATMTADELARMWGARGATILRTVATVAAGLVLAILSIGFLHPTAPHAAPAPTPTTSAHVAEDDPGWDCATMGNHECGPVDIGQAETVHAAAYCQNESGEVIYYPPGHPVTVAGAAVPCP